MARLPPVHVPKPVLVHEEAALPASGANLLRRTVVGGHDLAAVAQLRKERDRVQACHLPGRPELEGGMALLGVLEAREVRWGP